MQDGFDVYSYTILACPYKLPGALNVIQNDHVCESWFISPSSALLSRRWLLSQNSIRRSLLSVFAQPALFVPQLCETTCSGLGSAFYGTQYSVEVSAGLWDPLSRCRR